MCPDIAAPISHGTPDFVLVTGSLSLVQDRNKEIAESGWNEKLVLRKYSLLLEIHFITKSKQEKIEF